MTKGVIDERQVDRDFHAISEIRRIAWQRDPVDVIALIERLRVHLMIEDMPRRRRRMYRALIDYFEDVMEDRFEKEGHADRRTARCSALEYVRDIIKGIDDEQT